MSNCDEKDVVSSSQISPEPIDSANNNSLTEAAPFNPMKTGVKVTEVVSRINDGVACGMPFVSEGEKSKINEKQMEVEKNNGAKASKSSWRVMFHTKENASISSSQLSEAQSKTIEETDDTSTLNVMFRSEELKFKESEMESKKNFKQNSPDVDRNCETNALQKEIQMESNDQQNKESETEKGGKLTVDGDNNKARICDQIGDTSNEEAILVEKKRREKTKKFIMKAEKTGMIFMCNSRTKQDCFDYNVFGLPANMRDVVRKVSKGTRLFLFDIDLRVMYGIYRAAAPGDYNIEPNAFKSAFPSQVRFTVVEDCTPLPEETFRMAIEDNYYRRNMFYCQLTSEQVKKLSRLFVAASGGPNSSYKNYVKQENLIDEEMVAEDVTVENKGKAAMEEENGETAIAEEKNYKKDFIEKEKADEVILVDSDDEETSCEEYTSEGMIFLCNSSTKQDCLNYKVLGLPANMREIVKKVRKGMALFMFDVDLRMMYGVYKAAEPGGYNIQPKAFNSAFPSQVRFTVVKDCAPLPEEKFKEAIINNYYWKNKFNCQLTSEQVKKLSKLFTAVNNSLSNSIMFNPVDMNIDLNVKKEYPIREPEEEVGVNADGKKGKKRKRRKEKKLMQRGGITGMIFMCNSKTKQDCLRYKVLGLPENMREMVQKVEKGMRLFMFDVDLRVMYGIYIADGPGGYNIEPKAFNSGFPSQVRFTVLEDCLPLGEEDFKPAIKDNYFTKSKFKSELTVEQVKNLCKIFSSAGKSRDRTRQHNQGHQYHDHRIRYGGDSYIKRVLVPMAQIPPLDYHAPPNFSHGKVNISRSGPLLRRRGQRRVSFRQFRTHGAASRSVERKNMLYVKDLEMKSRYFEEECKRLATLLQHSAAENQSLRVSLQNAVVYDDFHL